MLQGLLTGLGADNKSLVASAGQAYGDDSRWPMNKRPNTALAGEQEAQHVKRWDHMAVNLGCSQPCGKAIVLAVPRQQANLCRVPRESDSWPQYETTGPF